MSEILNEFIIQPTEALFTVESTNLIVNPDAIQLNVYTGAAPVAGGSNTNVQFNEDGVLQGSNSFTFNNVSETVTIGNLAIGNVANLGGTSNVKISGGTNGYVLQTDGTGNLSWTAQAGNVTGNGTPGGSNTQIQYNNSGNFGGSAGFTFDSASNVMNVPGNLIAAGEVTASYFNGNIDNANLANYAGYVVNGNQSNITAVGLLSNLSVAGTISGNVISTTGDITSNANITANGHFVGNLWGTANTAVTVTANAQSNITSLGILTGLQVNGDINANANSIYANVIQANTIIGNTANANYSLYAGTVLTNAQPNITSVGTLTSLSVSSNNIQLANGATSNTGNAVAIGRNANAYQQSGVAIGNAAQATGLAIGIGANARANGSYSISIGQESQAFATYDYNIAIGANATAAGNNASSLGWSADASGEDATAIGSNATASGNTATAVGSESYARNSGVSLGFGSGNSSINNNAISIGYFSGKGAGSGAANAINIGSYAGYSGVTPANTITLNATGANLTAAVANAFFVKPIRDVTGNAGFTVALYYNPTTGEIGYK